MKINMFLVVLMIVFTANYSDARSDLGTLVGNVKAKDAVIFLEEVGNETFGKARGTNDIIVRASATDSPRATLDQEDKVFLPHVLTIKQGTVVDILNSDDFLHNVHMYNGSDMKTLKNLAMALKGWKLSYKIIAPGEIVILCDVHKEMSAYILVLPNDYFARSDENGDFEITGIDPGRYHVKIWQEDKKIKDRIVEIKLGVNQF